MSDSASSDVSKGNADAAQKSRLAVGPALVSFPPKPWSSGIFACCQDIGSCFRTLFCPAATFGTLANAIDNTPGSKDSCCTYLAMQFCLSSATLSSKYRGRIREKYNLLEEPLSDYATHCLLGPCALCQEYRELKYNNVDLEQKKKKMTTKKSLRSELFYKSVERALQESVEAEDGSIVWLTTKPGGPPKSPNSRPATT
ncbi:protein PLANT CADMIUM RESISTANCE 7 [Physcomitrium patens]|uniref:protein PLANT CADMIUM RESISTANCE 7 n=1 Tax=Physcomitrium patens TaxID=3218 RepID=UPI000D17B42C|nr:protein PLANT CADMIUM RESISTANCE 7-like [Physcomitrium patens]|eukprot:XP_024390985.1 protein PLANT CADMIUM RESISTANCE 7-like [Physcomitrella patens]